MRRVREWVNIKAEGRICGEVRVLEGRLLFQCNRERKKGSYVDLVSRGHEVIFETETEDSFILLGHMGIWRLAVKTQ